MNSLANTDEKAGRKADPNSEKLKNSCADAVDFSCSSAIPAHFYRFLCVFERFESTQKTCGTIAVLSASRLLSNGRRANGTVPLESHSDSDDGVLSSVPDPFVLQPMQGQLTPEAACHCAVGPRPAGWEVRRIQISPDRHHFAARVGIEQTQSSRFLPDRVACRCGQQPCWDRSKENPSR
jgi:hypothetical protein